MVTLAEDGEQGLALFEKNEFNFDLIITDLMMPKLDGYGMAKKIRFELNNTMIPIIAITAGVIENTKNHQILFNYLLQKPLNMKGLIILSESVIKRCEELQNHPNAI